MIEADRMLAVASLRHVIDAARPLSVSISVTEGRRLIHVSGELDFGSRDVVHGACVVDDGCDVMIDLRGLTFLDCSGYSGVLAARHELASRGGSLALTAATGQPARFLSLLAQLEHRRLSKTTD